MNWTKKVKKENGGGLVGMLAVVVIIAVVVLYMMRSGKDNSLTDMDKGAVQKTLEKTRTAADGANLTILRQAINRYMIEKGNYPETLKQLADERYVPSAALKDSSGAEYSYNPQTGEVSFSEN